MKNDRLISFVAGIVVTLVSVLLLAGYEREPTVAEIMVDALCYKSPAPFAGCPNYKAPQ